MSTNPFDEFRRAQPAANPFDEFQPVGPTARQTLTTAVTMKPDSVAEAARLAKRYPAPPEVIMQDLEAYRLQEVLDLADTDLQKAPMLREIMRRDVKVAAMAQDDTARLVDLEKRVRAFGELKPWNGPEPTTLSVVTGLAKSIPQAAGAIKAGLQMQMGDALEALGLVKRDPVYLANQQRKLAQAVGASDFTRPNFESSTAAGVYGGAESFLRALPGVAASVAMRSPTPAMIAIGGQTQAEAYGKYRARGGTPGEAFTGATGEALVEIATEYLPGKYLAESLGKTGAKEFILNLVKKDVLGEQVATILQDAIDTAIANPDKTWDQYLAERPDAAYQTLVATLTQAGLMSGVNTVMRRVAEMGDKSAEAQATADALQQAMQGAEASRLRERNPEAFRDVMAQMSQDGSIYIDAEVLNQMPPELLQQMQGVAEALPDALAANSSVEVKLADALTLLPGTPQAEVFMQNARSAPDAPSLVEAEAAGAQAQQFLQQEAERVIAQAQDQEAMRASSEAVRQSILGELNTAGRYRGKVNEGMASWASAFYTAYSSRLGITPEEMYQRYRLRVLGAPTGQGEVLNAPRLGRLDGIEAFNFGKSNRTTLSGGNFGNGLAGNNRDAYLNAADKRLAKRIYFYVDKGTGINPEAGVGGIARKFNLDNVYDGDADPLRLKSGRDQLGFESAVLDAGFSGYLTRMGGTQSGQVILLGDQTVTGELLGPTTRTTGKRVPDAGARPSAGRDIAADALRARKDLPAGELTRQRWGELLQRLAPAEYEALAAAGVFEGEGRLYKDGLIRDFESRTQAPTYEQAARVTTGRELFGDIVQALGLTDQEFNATALEYMTGLPGNMAFLPPYQGGLTEVVAFLHERRLKAGLPPLDINKPEDRAQLARLVAAEALAAIRNAGDSLEWYDTTVGMTLGLMALKYPELNTDPNARTAFLIATAIASQGLNVEDNLAFSSEQYEAFRAEVAAGRTGKFPITGKGESAGAMEANFQKANDLLEEMGPDLLRRFLVTPFTVRELETAGFPIGGENMDTMVLGSAVFGPKIGFGFYSNLNGNFEPTTMDMWFMRTIGRLAGTLPAFDQGKFNKQVKRLRDALTERGPKARGLFASQFDKALVAAAKTDDNKLIELARLVKKAHEKDFKTNRAGFDNKTRVKTDLVGAAETILFSLEKPRDIPASGGERNNLRDVVAQVVDLVAQNYGQRVPPAALQALIWYPEQEFYKAMGVKLRVTSQDYAGAARKLLESEGFNGQQLDGAAQRGAAAVRPADGAAVSGSVPGNDQGVGRARPLEADERTRLLVERNARILAEQRAAAARIAFEVAPDPNDLALTAQWRQLDQQQRLDISNRVAQQIVPKVLKFLKGKGEVLPQVGSYLEDTNPSFALRVDKGDVDQLSKILGFVLSQDSMMAIAPAEFPGAFNTQALRVEIGEKTAAEVDQIYQALRAIKLPDGRQPIAGQSTSGGIMTVLLDSQDDGATIGALVDQALAGAYNVGVADVFAAFPEKQDYDYARVQDDPAGDEGLARQRARDARAEASELLRAELDGTQPAGPAADNAAGSDTGVLEQGPRGTFNPRTLELVLSPTADLSTFFHETGHFFLEVLADIASQPGAPAQIVEDMNAFLKWAGVPDLATWNGYTLEQKRPYHERWAEGIEQYVMEGKAPNTELQPLMRRFSAWLKSVYKSITQFVAGKPELELNDDIRRVMDRMLATDEQIQQANEVAGLVPDEQADGEAAERLQKRSMADLKWAVRARDAVIAKLKKQAREIEKASRAEVTVEVDQMPEMRAKAALDALAVTPEYAGILAEHKAQRQAAETQARQEITDAAVAAEEAKGGELKGLKKGQFLAKMKREIGNQVEARMIEWDRANPRPARPVNATDQDVATIADSFGFESVDAMLQAIDAFGPRAEAIDGLTEQRMLEENGDLIDERAIQEAANEAVHNEARARSLATELRTQREMLGQRTDTGETNARGARITVNALVEAAKQFGANVIARTPLKDLKATAWKHTAAERRAGKRWAEATAKGETADAVKAKQDQVLNNAAAKAALDATNEAKKILEFFKRVTKGNDEKTVEKGRDPDIVNAARAVLAAYGIETPTTKAAAAYLEALQQNDPETAAVVGPMILQATQNAQPLEALTFEELQGLHESVQAMWFLAKRTRQMEVDGDLMDIDDAAGELYTRMEEIGIPDTVPGESGALTKAELVKRAVLQQAPALLRRVEQWAEAKDGKFGGPFLRLIFQPIKDAADRYRAERLEYRKKFQALVDDVALLMWIKPIEAPELGYTFGRGHNGIGMAELLHAILHTGNESNKRKLLLGRGWATENPDGTLDTSRWDAFIQRLANSGVLQREHFDFAQGVWDLLEQTKPLAQKTHRDVFGRYFAEVTADTFTDPFGVARRGGYVPAQADPLLVQDAELRDLLETENAGMSYAFPSTNRGFTKSRVEYNRPLKLDLRSLPQHIDKVLLFSHMEAPVRSAARLIKRPKVSQPLGRIDPAAISGVLKPWLNRSARQTVETPISADAGLNRMLSTIRGRVGMALMFANLSNTLQQITGLSSAAVKVKPALMMRSLADYVANPKKFAQAVWDASPYMADRASNEVAVLSDTLEKILINPSVYESAEQFTRRHAYFLQTAFDNVLSPIIWQAAYNQGLAEGMEERMATRYADGVIRQTQGSTLPEDVSRIETGPAYARVFTQFVSYFNMLANTNATALQQIAQEQGLRKGAGKAFGVLMLGLMAPIWVAEAIAIAFRGGPDDEDDDGYLDDWLAQVFGFGTIKGVLSGIPFVGALGQSVVNRFNDQPADDKFSLSPTVSVLESAAGAPASVYKAIVDDASAQKAVRDVAALITVTTGMPAMTLARPLGYGAGVAQGKIEPTSEADFVRGLVTGTASPESKVR
jgi:hypothetical protein